MTSNEETVGMDVLCRDKTAILTLNKLTMDKNLIELTKLNYFMHRYLPKGTSRIQ